MRVYYGSKISDNMTKTPEGYLICLNVPIGRVGVQEYAGQELGFNDAPHKMVSVHREESEVFSPAAMASFEGKTVTDGHPSIGLIDVDTEGQYRKGHAQSIRRGTGEESDLLLADLFITDPILISEIENGKREVSSGYDCDWVPGENGEYYQQQIRGNHIAVVTSGRAGGRVAIKDSNENIERSKNPMATDKKTIWGRMLGVFAKDASPEEMAAAAQMMPNDEAPPQPAEAAKPEDPLAKILIAIEDISKRLAALEASDKQVHADVPKDGLDQLETEIEPKDDPDGEEAVTIDPQKIAKEPEMKPKFPASDSITSALKAARAACGAIKDPIIRKAASDAAAVEIRNTFGVGDGYGKILDATSRTAQQRALDSQPKDDGDLGKRIAAERNPHYKKEAK